MRLILVILFVAAVAYAITHMGARVKLTDKPLPSEAVVDIHPPEASCPGCVGPSVDNQPRPVYPMDTHQTYEPATKPVPYTPAQPGPPFAPKFGIRP